MTEIIDSAADVVDDAFVLLRWMHELAQDTPNAAVVASLESVAEDNGWHPYDAWQALTAAPGFNPDVHPRGKDGQFIEKFGMVRLDGKVDTGTGSKVDATGQRGQVEAIIPDPDQPGNPTIRVKLTQPDGTPAGTVDVKPNQVSAATEKARLDTPAAPDAVAVAESDRDNFVYDDPDMPGDVINTEFPNPTKQTDAELDAELARYNPDVVAEMNDPQIDAYVEAVNAEKAKRAAPAEQPAMLGGPNHTTIPPEEAARLADEVLRGNPVTVDPPNLDDVIAHFADSDTPVDLTLLPPFDQMKQSEVQIPRAEMPQIPKEHLDTFKRRLKTDGFTFTPDAVDPASLTATQAELDGKNVSGMMHSARAGTFDMLKDPIWISNDGKVLDGHHRWAAATALSTNCDPPGCVQMQVVRVDMPMSELLGYANRFNDEMGVERLGFGTSRPQPATPGGSNFAPPAAAASGMVAAGEDELTPEEAALTMATDEEDGITAEYLTGAVELYHGKPSEPGEPETAAGHPFARRS